MRPAQGPIQSVDSVAASSSEREKVKKRPPLLIPDRRRLSQRHGFCTWRGINKMTPPLRAGPSQIGLAPKPWQDCPAISFLCAGRSRSEEETCCTVAFAEMRFPSRLPVVFSKGPSIPNSLPVILFWPENSVHMVVGTGEATRGRFGSIKVVITLLLSLSLLSFQGSSTTPRSVLLRRGAAQMTNPMPSTDEGLRCTSTYLERSALSCCHDRHHPPPFVSRTSCSCEHVQGVVSGGPTAVHMPPAAALPYLVPVTGCFVLPQSIFRGSEAASY